MMVMGTTLLLLLLGLFSFLIIIITVDLKVVGFVPVVGVVARMSWRLNSSAFLSSLNDNDNNNDNSNDDSNDNYLGNEFDCTQTCLPRNMCDRPMCCLGGTLSTVDQNCLVLLAPKM